MRKVAVVLLSLVLLGAGLAMGARGRSRGGRRGRPVAAQAVPTIPTSAQIAAELGTIQWGWTKEQIIEYYKQQIAARYRPQMHNLGLIEQDRLLAQRDKEVEAIANSYIVFNGLPAQRRWDSSIIGQEYTHGNNESMLAVNDAATGNREFFFFINGKLWKRYQARAIPIGAQLEYETFAASMEGLFGPGLRIPKDDDPSKVQTVVWRDDNTVLHLADYSSFYSTFGIIFEEGATLSRITELRRNMPTAAKAVLAQTGTAPADSNEHTGAAVDPNADISARIAARIRSQIGDASVSLSGGDGGLFAPSPKN